MEQIVAMETVVSGAAVQSHNSDGEDGAAHTEIITEQRSTCRTPPPPHLAGQMQVCHSGRRSVVVAPSSVYCHIRGGRGRGH